MANEITFLFERARGRARLQVHLHRGRAGTKRTGQLVNNAVAQPRTPASTRSPGAHHKLLLSQALPGGVTELANLEARPGSTAASRPPAPSTSGSAGTEQQLVGTTDYTQCVTVAATHSSHSHSAHLTFVACRHTRVE